MSDGSVNREEQVPRLASPTNAELSAWPFVAMTLAVVYDILRERRRVSAWRPIELKAETGEG